jgi:hypothetical protein
MEGKARTAWYTFIVIFGSAILLLGGFAVISYEERLATAASATEADSVELFDHDRRLHNSIKALSHCAVSVSLLLRIHTDVDRQAVSSTKLQIMAVHIRTTFVCVRSSKS